MGCNIVITDKGDAREYFGPDAFYCDPGNPVNIRAAIEKASRSKYNGELHDMIQKKYTWEQAAKQTYQAYEQTINL
jgi:glycosyltransferase involved in cell wall biosynthesis